MKPAGGIKKLATLLSEVLEAVDEGMKIADERDDEGRYDRLETAETELSEILPHLEEAYIALTDKSLEEA